ncbi:testis-expressed protein 47 isoform 2-T2 [Aplochiton taeniatus]
MTLFGKMERSNRANGKKFLLHRLVVIASLPQQLDDRRDLGAHCEELNQRLQRYHQGDGITGLLLLYPTCMVHLIESSSDILLSVLEDMRDMEEKPNGGQIKAARVLVMSHDLPSRLFQQWSYKVLNGQTRTLDDGPEQETTETLLGTVLSVLFKLGNYHQYITKDSKSPPGSEPDEAQELIVPQGVLDQLLLREEFLSPKQYLHTYHSPFNILMDSECVWPPPDHLGLTFPNYGWQEEMNVICD